MASNKIHKFYQNGMYILLDVNSSTVHLIDKTVYDVMDYFDGTVISDYQSDRMVAGGYRYEGENTDELIALGGYYKKLNDMQTL